MGISENIKKLREEKGISQSKVAELIGIDRANYFRLEKRGNKLTIEQLEKIAGVLGVTVTEMLTGEAQKVENSEEVERLRRRIEEREEIILLQKEERHRLSNYFIERLRDCIEITVLRNLVWSYKPLISSDELRIVSAKIIASVNLLKNNTDEFIINMSPLMSNILNFLLEYTDDIEYHKRPFNHFGKVYVGDLQESSKAILRVVESYSKPSKVPFELRGTDITSNHQWENLKKIAEELKEEEEGVLGIKRNLFKDIPSVYAIKAEIIYNKEGRKDAYNFVIANKSWNKTPEDLLIKTIVQSSVIREDEMSNIFK